MSDVAITESAIPALSDLCRDTAGLFGAFTTLKELREEALSLASEDLESADAQSALAMLTRSHELWRERLAGAILHSAAAADLDVCVPRTTLAGPRALATACSLELAFLKTLVDAPGFCMATRMQELNVARAAEEFDLDEIITPDAMTGGTYL